MGFRKYFTSLFLYFLCNYGVIIIEYFDTGPDSSSGKGQFQKSACGGTCKPGLWQPYDLKPDAVPYCVIKGGEPIFAKSAEANPVLFHKKKNSNFIEREEIKSVAALPLNAKKECVGCIFFNFNHYKEFGPQQRLEIRMMAEYAAIAIYQVRLVNEKSALLRYAQHQLNQPLNAIRGFLSNLSEGYYNTEQAEALSGDGDQYKRSKFGKIAQNRSLLCRYMVDMLDTFLKIDLIQDPDKDIFKIKINKNESLSDLCNRAVDVAVAYRTSQSPIFRNIATNVVGCFDPNAIQTAIINVLVNAIKYGDSKGEHKSKHAIQLHLTTEDKTSERWAIIRVDDSGPGIRPEDRSRIFRPLERVGSGGRGLGVGLYLTKEYIERHLGDINVSESDAGGARFTNRFPLNPKIQG
jgi:signal transduction histidine kinase